MLILEILLHGFNLIDSNLLGISNEIIKIEYPKLKEHLENFKKIHDNYNKAVDLSLYYYSYLIENDVKSIRTSYIVNE